MSYLEAIAFVEDDPRRGRALLERALAEDSLPTSMLAAVAVRAIHERAPDRSFLEHVYPAVRRLHDELAARVDPLTDLQAASAWARACDDLAALARDRGRADEAASDARRATRTREAVRSTWDERAGLFRPAHLPHATSASLLPLFGRVPTPAMAARLVDAVLDPMRFGGALGVPSLPFDHPEHDPGVIDGGAIAIETCWMLATGLRDYGYHDVARELATRVGRLVRGAGPHRHHDASTGEGLGPAGFPAGRLAERMRADRASPLFDDPVVVIELGRLPDAEARAVYDHPGRRDVDVANVEQTSCPTRQRERVLDAVAGAARAADDPTCELGARLTRLASAVRRTLVEAKPPGDDDPRLCDVASVAAAVGARALGLDARVVWSPDLHYFVVVEANDRHWVVDTTADQFRTAEASRAPLLLERATLELERALDGRPSWLAIETALREARERLGDLAAGTPPRRLAPAARAALLRVRDRHLAVVAAARERAPDTDLGRVLAQHAAFVQQNVPRPVSARGRP